MIRSELGKITLQQTYQLGLEPAHLVKAEDFVVEDGTGRVLVLYRVLATGTQHVATRSSFVRRFLPVQIEQPPAPAEPPEKVWNVSSASEEK